MEHCRTPEAKGLMQDSPEPLSETCFPGRAQITSEWCLTVPTPKGSSEGIENPIQVQKNQ